jgi:hypothetical protein
MYNNYLECIKQLNKENIKQSDFKSNSIYNHILEHVSYELGTKYLNLISNEFSYINTDKIVEYLNINDTYGVPIKHTYNLNNNLLYCSPTSLRYVYHALVILDYYKNTGCRNIVELGCGYGGLCLAINFFSKFLHININNYHLIDLPVACNLIDCYLDVNKSNIYTNILLHSSDVFGYDIVDSNLFFISNYCYTEIDKTLNTCYSKILLPKTSNGFIIWQNGAGICPINNAEEITGKNTKQIIEERPQTDVFNFGNYFVYF